MGPKLIVLRKLHFTSPLAFHYFSMGIFIAHYMYLALKRCTLHQARRRGPYL